MLAQIIERTAKVYSEPTLNSQFLTELPIGEEIDLGRATKKDGQDWVEVTLSTGQKGFVPGDTRIYRVKPAVLLQESVNVYAQPSMQAAVTRSYRKNQQFLLLRVVSEGEQGWVKIRDAAGNEGFIDGKTQIKVLPENSVLVNANKEIGKKNMIFGALWFIGGILVTGITYSLATGGGTYLVTWGAIIFGAIQFFRGLIEYRKE